MLLVEFCKRLMKLGSFHHRDLTDLADLTAKSAKADLTVIPWLWSSFPTKSADRWTLHTRNSRCNPLYLMKP